MVRWLVILVMAGAAIPALAGPGDTLVGDPFISGYNGWAEVPQTNGTGGGGGPTNWGINLRAGGLQESSDARVTASGANNELVKSVVMVNDYMTPSEYTLSSRMAVYDDDGWGVMFGYQDISNWYRVSFRIQDNGNLGYPKGVSVQRCVNGTITSLGKNTTWWPTLSHMGGPTAGAPAYNPFDLDVKVTSAGWGVYINGGANPILSGTQAVPAGKVGVHAWYQFQQGIGTDPAYPQWGTQWKSVSVKDAGGTPVFQDSFNASPVAWRPLQMVKAPGTAWTMDGDDYGDFLLDFRNGTIRDDSNGYENGGFSAGKVGIDFVGPAIVVDSPGSSTMSDYQMKVRMKCLDNDGIGVLLRVQDDDSFYRVNFTSEAMSANWRAPQGLSVQKCDNGVWTELFRDDQAAPKFIYTLGQAFDLDVMVVGNDIRVLVIGDPDGARSIIDYGWITDYSDNPLLTGTVGFTNWGNGDAAAPALWSAYGGVAGTPLLTQIPEPTVCVLLAAGGAMLMARRRRSPA